MSSECNSGAKKLIEFPNNVRNVLRDIKLPLENIMGHLGWQIVVTLEKTGLRPKNGLKIAILGHF